MTGAPLRPSPAQRVKAQASFLLAVDALRSSTRSQVADWIDRNGDDLDAEQWRYYAGLDWQTFSVALRHHLGTTVAPLFADTAQGEAQRLGVAADSMAFHRWWDRRSDVLLESSVAGVVAALALAHRRQLDPWARAGVVLRSAGLNQPQAIAVENLRQGALDAGMTAAQAEAKADQASGRFLGYREHLVADTELTSAQRAGALSVDAVAFGSGGALEHLATNYELEFQAWSGACDICSGMDGDRAAVGDEDEGDGGHARCQCNGWVLVEAQ